LRKKASSIDNIIIILCDALRADHIGAYGYILNTSPNINRLAENGLLCLRAVSQASYTKSSIASFFTSFYPSVNKTTKGSVKKGSKYEGDILPDEFLTMAEIFRDNGYFTYGIHQNPHISSKFNYNQGFNVYKYGNTGIQIEETIYFLRHGYLVSDLDFAQINNLLDEKTDINLVENGGFEQNVFWEGKFQLSTQNAFKGKNSLYISKKFVPQENFWHLRSKKIRVKKGNRYIFGAFARTQGLKGSLRVELVSEENSGRRSYNVTNSLSNDNDWTLLSGAFQAKSNNIFIRPSRIQNFKNGDIWIDNCFLIAVDQLSDICFFRPAKSFIYLHNLDVHGPYTPSVPFINLFVDKIKNREMASYDAEIRELDTMLGLLFEELKNLKILEKTLIILTADHGEAFGEHGIKGHGAGDRFDVTIRVPLIFSNPILFPEPRIVDCAVQLLDVLPTLIDIFQLKFPRNYPFQGVSVFSKKPSRKKRIAFNYGYEKIVAATNFKWKYIIRDDGKVSLYNIIEDPQENVDLADKNPEIVEFFKKMISRQKMRDTRTAKIRKADYKRRILDKEEESKLKSLGYIK
jgi:arylsulfatase A-like enzyme